MVSTPEEIKNLILSRLEEIATPKKRERELAFFKYKVTNIIGTGIKPMRSIISRMAPLFKTVSDEDLVLTVEKLVKTEIYEAQLAAIEILYISKDRLDLNKLFTMCSGWIEDGILDNWAVADNAAKYVMGYAVLGNHGLGKATYRWTKSANVWMRRASLVTYIIPAREGKCYDIIFKTARKLMRDENEYVMRAVGWVLREAGDSDRLRLENFIFKHGKDMRRISLRSAIENFPEEERNFLIEQTKTSDYLEEKYRERLMEEMSGEDYEDKDKEDED